MSSGRVRRIGVRIVAPPMLLAALAGCLMAGPGAGSALADGSGSGGVEPPSPTGSFSSNGPTYTSTIGGGNTVVSGTPWIPPSCWMQPYFPQSQTWKASDPSGQPTDADSFYSWFVGQGATGTSSAAQMTSDFKDIQDRQAPAGWTGPDPIEANDVWWAPDWLDSTTGYACAQGMAAKNNLSNGYLGLEPPLQENQQSPLVGAINVTVLAQLTKAEITLPKVSVITSPPGTAAKSAVVNTPTYVAVEYDGDMNPSKIQYDGGDFGLARIWASVQATIVGVTVPASSAYSTTGFGDPGQTCAAVNGEATPACTVTFRTPSGNTPDNLTVNVTWKVTWSTSAGNGATDPIPGVLPATATVVVKEIQSQT
jgi:hypothetical protein